MAKKHKRALPPGFYSARMGKVRKSKRKGREGYRVELTVKRKRVTLFVPFTSAEYF